MTETCKHGRQRFDNGRRICKDCGEDVGPAPDDIKKL